ncbi:MAG: PASTA domain-containing protein [Candidatus Latescibacteria bacterium]|nr:PASTA domain-containing protein [Candidatus Latescibacterota bacterium]
MRRGVRLSGGTEGDTMTGTRRTRLRIWGGRIWLLARIGLGLALGALLLDRVVMPQVVRHGSDVIVPSVTDRPEETGIALLREAGLAPGSVRGVPDPQVAAGRIVSQDPPAGTRVREGRGVHLLVSRGSPVREVPALAGKSFRHAQLELSRRGLGLGRVTRLATSLRADGEVIASRPPAGRLPGPDGLVDLLVGEPNPQRFYVMPDFRGARWQEAAARLRQIGVRVSHWGAHDRVFRQDPGPGGPIRPGMTVILD